MKQVKKAICHLNDVPSEVQWACIILNTSHGVGLETYERLEQIVAKYPEYFPWEDKYNSIPKEVHQAYIKEKYPDMDKPIVCTNSGEGIMSAINKDVFVYKQKTAEEIMQWFKDLAAMVKEDNDKEEKEKQLWDKHYSKYGLKYRKMR